MATKLSDSERLVAYAVTAPLAELESTIRTLTVIHDSRAEGKASKASKAKSASSSSDEAKTTKPVASSVSTDGKDPERVARGRKAAETRARKKAEQEAQAQAQVEDAPNPTDDLGDLENFHVPRPQFGPEGELLAGNE